MRVTVKNLYFDRDVIREHIENDEETLAKGIAYCKHKSTDELSDEEAKELAIGIAQEECFRIWQEMINDEYCPYSEPSAGFVYSYYFCEDVKVGKTFALDNSYWDNLSRKRLRARRTKRIIIAIIVAAVIYLVFFAGK